MNTSSTAAEKDENKVRDDLNSGTQVNDQSVLLT